MPSESSYIQVYSLDRLPVFIDLRSGRATWTLAPKEHLRSIKYLTHFLSEEDTQCYYEDVNTQETSWTLPESPEMSEEARDIAATVFSMTRQNVEALCGKSYQAEESIQFMNKVDMYLISLEDTTNDNNHFNDDNEEEEEEEEKNRSEARDSNLYLSESTVSSTSGIAFPSIEDDYDDDNSDDDSSRESDRKDNLDPAVVTIEEAQRHTLKVMNCSLCHCICLCILKQVFFLFLFLLLLFTFH